MKLVRGEDRKSLRLSCLLGATALACLAGLVVPPAPTFAQDTGGFGDTVSPNAQMLIEADTLIYDNERNTVTADGAVQIDYDGNRLVADRVIYDRGTNRLIAEGGVEIIDKDGNRITSDRIDVTDDFRDGFVEALRVETPDKTYFAANSAQREDGERTTFNQAVYTACEPCEDKPDKAPIWRIKGRKIVWDGKKKTVTFYGARFELFGMPIAYLPYFVTADPTVKRKSGFLIPSVSFSDYRGTGVKVPYYFALSPTYDLTVSPTYYANQGFMAEAEWRQRFNNGEYSITIAGISQRDPGAFPSRRVDSAVTRRGMVGSKGAFTINPRWTFGWDVLVQSDKNFAATYDIKGFDDARSSEIFLTGLHDRNYFDLRAYRFFVQETRLNTHPLARSKQQPWVLPSFDYAKTLDEAVFGGELSFDINAQGIYRPSMSGTDGMRLIAPGGSSGRLTAETEWRRSFITLGGLVLTPSLSARGDGIFTNYSAATQAAISTLGPADIRSSYQRYMATAGLEARWPILMMTDNSTHIIEPIAQIFVRPDEPYAGTLGIPNEDAQSFVFDATTLFERDKFSGYDRIEGGTRANLGIRYTGTVGDEWAFNALVGQSYHIAGVNSFATPDLVNAGAFSGLESDVSDYVAMVGFSGPHRISMSAGGRFDEKTFEMRRADVKAATQLGPLALTGRYTFIQAQSETDPVTGDTRTYGFETDRHEVQAGASLKFADYWKVFGSGTFDLQSSTLIKNTYGFSYDDECFTFRLFVEEKRNRTTKRLTRDFGFNIAFRTIGDFGSSTSDATQF